MNKPRSKKISALSQKREVQPAGAKAAVLRLWKRLLADNHFDYRVTAFCHEYELNDYLPIGTNGNAVVTGRWEDMSESEHSLVQHLISSGVGVLEGARP